MKNSVFFVRSGNSDTLKNVAKKVRVLIESSHVLEKIRKNDFTAVKLHFGEKDNTGHIKPEWVKEAVNCLRKRTSNIFVSDSNVIYKASKRANSIDHLNIAKEHGFNIDSVGAPIIIADGLRGRNFTEIKIDGKHFKTVKIASDFADCDSMIAMTHITGHILTGVGGAIKNMGMGCASRRGKYEQHCATYPEVKRKDCVGCEACVKICPGSALKLKSGKIYLNKAKCLGCGECAVICRTKALEIRWSEKLENLQEKMVEYAKGVVNALNNRIVYINFLIKVTKKCDCLAKNDPRIVEDIGILASLDPVAIDKASIDLISEKTGRDIFSEGYPETRWFAQIEYASKIGLGSARYNLEIINE